MSCKFICDGCGKEEESSYSPSHDDIKPRNWYAKTTVFNGEKKVIHACCNNCVDIASKKWNTDNIKSPF
jgi:hypothetical protein